MDMLSSLYKDKYGCAPESVSKLAGAGGDRVYYRLSGCGGSAIGVHGDSERDCLAFIALSRIFGREGINVPEVYGASADGMWYLEQDLGDVSLLSVIQKDPESATPLVETMLKMLVRMQCISEDELRPGLAYPDFSKMQVMWDLNYFKYEFLKPAAIDFNETALEIDFNNFSTSLLEIDPMMSGFMMRDCQSRNVMVLENAGSLKTPYFIDYQGGRMGPCIYDAISFLWQAKAGFTDEFRDRMLRVYAAEYSSRRGVPVEEVMTLVPRFALFRTLQVLGAYGFRGLVQHRAHFVESIPGALQNLQSLIDSGACDSYPELKRVCGLLAGLPRFRRDDRECLTVRVFSFSYKKGYPEDLSGNGGGFMFDCRGMHNPGRYAEYRQLTGRDQPVIDFLKEKGEVDLFARRAFELVAPTVERYLRRGFNSLQIGFGCTGGQHRSVYCAEAVAHAVADAFPAARVELIHREQGIVENLTKSE